MPEARYRAYVFTWNNYPANYRETLDRLVCRYIVAGEEVAPNTGTHHLQGYVYFAHGKTETATRALLAGSHVERAHGTPKQCDEYCRKTRDVDDEPNAVVYSRGDRPLSPEEKGDLEKQRYENAWQLAKRGAVEEIDADIRLRLYGSIRRIERDFMPAVQRLGGPCGLWIRGVAGSGKTRSVLDTYPEAYPKPRTKWWDGYQGEEIVYCDDIDVFNVALGGELKLWADAYPFIGEIKGGSKKIRPRKFIVTSQYSIEEIWADAPTREALLRRFVVVEKILGQNIII